MQIITAVLILSGIGLVCGFLLAGASKAFAVPADPRRERALAALPCADCGACGFGSCGAYVDAALAGGDVNLCALGGGETAEALAEIAGAEVRKSTRAAAIVKCSGGTRASRKFDYAGIPDCVSASGISGGPLECVYGCLGLGTCEKVCAFGAISVVDGVAVVDRDLCTGCLACVKACPKGIIAAAPYNADVTVCCSSKEKGAVLRKICEIGCVGCRICEKTCVRGAIKVADNLAVIDHSKCTGCGDCAEKCPRRLITDANLDYGRKGEENEEDEA